MLLLPGFTIPRSDNANLGVSRLAPGRAVALRIEPLRVSPLPGFRPLTPSRLAALRAVLALQGDGWRPPPPPCGWRPLKAAGQAGPDRLLLRLQRCTKLLYCTTRTEICPAPLVAWRGRIMISTS